MSERMNMRQKVKSIGRGTKALLFFIFALALFFLGGKFIPRPLFDTSYSSVLESKNGQLLGARIAGDEQWRFPSVDSIPEKYEKCLLCFEDRYYYKHPGINIFSIGRAVVQNIQAREIVSGGSTITMQVCRLARGQKPRTVKNKLIEMYWALQLELYSSKKEILNLYASHAPFGGNVVGIEAASWRYFGRESNQLSWAESATLAVLPNAPSLIYPGRLDEKLKIKRNRLLQELYNQNKIDKLTYELAIEEPIPEKVNQLPNVAYHLTEKLAKEFKGRKIRSTIDYGIQEIVNEIVAKHHGSLKGNFINNLAIIVAEIPSKKVRAYVGNTVAEDSLFAGNMVDIIQSKRSTGSILKPFLYCKMIDEGLLTPKMLVPDVPIRFGGFTPMNFDRDYNGVVPAEEALARSLNIPAVQLLRDYGVAPFYSFLKSTGMGTLEKEPDHYGLSLILGGAEITLWDLTGMYASLGSILKTYNKNDGLYKADPFSKLEWLDEFTDIEAEKEMLQPVIRAGSIYSTFEALLKVTRPESETGWESFANARKIAWKTGTSFGFRDAWAVGVTSDYVVGVWVGNADGEGRPGLTGINSAAPVLFDVFGILPSSNWFEKPIDELTEIEVCAQSGYRLGEHCDSIISVHVPHGNNVGICPWHKRIHLNREGIYRVNANCYQVANMKHKNWFVLPPAMEFYFKRNNVFYSTLPPLLPGCKEIYQQMEFIYPREWNKLFIPVDLDGTPGKLIFELAHRQNKATVYWYIDEGFAGKTKGIHQLELKPDPGWHTIAVTDDLGNYLSKKFMVVNSTD